MRHWKHNSCKNRLTNWSLNLNQIKHNFWLFKIHCNRIKRQIIAYKKILANDVSNVGSLPGMYKEISKFNKNKATTQCSPALCSFTAAAAFCMNGMCTVIVTIL